MPGKYDQPFPDGHPIKGGRIIFGQRRPSSSETISTPEEAAPKIQPEDGASPPKLTQEELDKQFQEMLEEHAEGMRESALHQWKGSPSEKADNQQE